jgi:hypothetical protein
MRYIELNPIKTQADKDRTKALPNISKGDLDKLIKDKKETKIITPETKKRSRENSFKIREFVSESTLKVLRDNNYPFVKDLEDGLKDGINNEIQVDGDVFKLNSTYDILMDFLHIFKMREDKRAIESLYFNIYEKVKKGIQNATQSQKDVFNKLSFDKKWDLKLINTNLLALSNLGLLVSPGTLVVVPLGETGEGTKSDQQEKADCKPVPNPVGLIATNTWNLKPHITSIKNQRRRGTCTAFGTVAAVESAVSVKYQKKMNLSEQDLYKKQKFDWNPNIFDDYYGDGYAPLLSLSFQLLFGYKYPFERSWEYNPSTERIDDADHRKYTHSCDLYAGDCSNTNHQAQKRCFKILHKDLVEVVKEVCEFVEGIPIIGLFAGWVCDIVTEVIEVVSEVEVCIYDTEIAGTSRIKVSSFQVIWDPIFNTEVSTAKYLLSHNNPIVYCFIVPESFRTQNGPNGKGYIVFDKNEQRPKGAKGHCVSIVGYVDNENLPPNIVKGSGGGYFIIKNSWGKCKGDMGFYYAPYDWVIKWGTSMIALTNVERV